MPIYWLTLNDLTFPLLFLGMFLALMQFSLDVESAKAIRGWRGMLKRML